MDSHFYSRGNVVSIARELLGKLLVTNWKGQITSGRIVETEAYGGITDAASHAFRGRRTARTEVMYGPPGSVYVYLCYGIHYLFNIVTNKKEVPDAILIRALEPVEGVTVMLKRTGKKKADYSLTRGPGNLSRALALHTGHTGKLVTEKNIFVADDGFHLDPECIVATRRIGVDYAGEDAKLPYRFIVKGNPWVSGNKKQNAPVS